MNENRTEDQGMNALNSNIDTCDLLVVGSGLSGMCASLFAANRGLSVVQVSGFSPLPFHAGLLDVLGMSGTPATIKLENPINGIQALRQSNDLHPYANTEDDDLWDGFAEMISFLKEEGLHYRGSLNHNVDILTSIGTLKRSCFYPSSMSAGIMAYEQRTPGAILDIEDFRKFSARQVVDAVAPWWPGLRPARIRFPGTIPGQEVVPERLARSLEVPQQRRALIDAIAPHLKGEKVIGLPALLGVESSDHIVRELESALGCRVFEIPLPPPSIPGIRLNEAFDRGLRKRGVERLENAQVAGLGHRKDGRFDAQITGSPAPRQMRSRGVVLATGRFFGKGLRLTRQGIVEPLLNLPVDQPESRADYYQPAFLDRQGHRLNRAGVKTDSSFRPLRLGLKPLYPNLFTVGIINAYQDWVREKCGSGIAVASAYRAINLFSHQQAIARPLEQNCS